MFSGADCKRKKEVGGYPTGKGFGIPHPLGDAKGKSTASGGDLEKSGARQSREYYGI